MSWIVGIIFWVLLALLVGFVVGRAIHYMNGDD
jgi:hypothetical protein